jgi:long-chain acyl-CoA synthetase
MSGYRHLGDATAEAIDPDGWLHTGDLGTLDDEGYLKIVDRIKEIIISAAGKNMSPINIEAALKSASPLIGVPVCIGDGRPYNTALITLDPAVADGRGADDPDLVRAVQAAVDAANEQLSRVEKIKRFSVIDGEWHPDGDELTPTSKLKRRAITAKYASEIEAMYPGQ